MIDRLAELDRLLFCLINQGMSHPALDALLGVFTYLGDGQVLAVLGGLGLYVFDRKNFPKNFLVLALVTLLGGLWVQIVKSLVGRPRPLKDPALGVQAAEVVKMHVIGWIDTFVYPLQPADPSLTGVAKYLHIVGAKLGSRSYPSGHSAAAFGVAAALAYAYRRWTYLLFIPAALVGLSRIYVGVHFPVDALVGAAIGVVNAWALLDWLRPYTGIGLVRPKGFAPRTSPPGEPSIMVVAGEASADTYAARLITAIRDKVPGARFVGVGGDRAIAAGLQPLGKAAELAIVGFTGVLRGLPALRRIFRALLARLDGQRPDALVCLDLPDFNLGLANQAKARGVPVIYYISPQVWAWRTGRLATIADRIDHMVVALPFEKDLYEKHDVAASFFGHPIMETIADLDIDREATRRRLGLDVDRPVLVFAPGSRHNEIVHLAPVYAVAAGKLAQQRPGLQFLVPLAATVDEAAVRAYFADAGVEPVFARDDFFATVACADAGIITSGTATLEAALAGLPIAIAYRGNRLNIALARRLVKIDNIGLPNIILGRIAFRELIQEDCTPETVADMAASLLDGAEREAALAACRAVREALGREHVSERVADVVLRYAAREEG